MRNLIILLILTVPLYAVEITVNTSQGRKAISPYIYGKNNSLSDNPSTDKNRIFGCVCSKT